MGSYRNKRQGPPTPYAARWTRGHCCVHNPKLLAESGGVMTMALSSHLRLDHSDAPSLWKPELLVESDACSKAHATQTRLTMSRSPRERLQESRNYRRRLPTYWLTPGAGHFGLLSQGMRPMRDRIYCKSIKCIPPVSELVRGTYYRTEGTEWRSVREHTADAMVSSLGYTSSCQDPKPSLPLMLRVRVPPTLITPLQSTRGSHLPIHLFLPGYPGVCFQHFGVF
ncbi:hypothetical protein BC826DRAFT_440988 [Russula brevipes]|nr:hypothetical protein BC826DRAFT_440988 [Russula brevipes]